MAAEQAQWRRIAEFLFGLLDDIDTVDDMVRSNDQAYRTRVRALQKRRFEVGMADGYKVGFIGIDDPADFAIPESAILPPVEASLSAAIAAELGMEVGDGG